MPSRKSKATCVHRPVNCAQVFVGWTQHRCSAHQPPATALAYFQPWLVHSSGELRGKKNPFKETELFSPWVTLCRRLGTEAERRVCKSFLKDAIDSWHTKKPQMDSCFVLFPPPPF
uniref:Uncharacterized protein n=1 Tax=Micrurus spixii TaxID=129469 RepID=A0A2D4MCY1_9SAUR